MDIRQTDKALQNTGDNIDWTGESWVTRPVSFPGRTVRLGTAFSGIGAIEYALRRLGIRTEIQFAGDTDKNCKKAYQANYGISDDRWHTDIKNFDATPFEGRVDLLVGGAPCQAFSVVGDQLGFKDTRGTLFSEFARVIMECRPKVFIFENVQGLLRHDGGRTWEVIRRTFEDSCGYDIHYQLLNSRDYGVPQTRERLYCIGFREPTEFRFPAPVELNYRMYDFLEDYRDTPYYDENSGKKYLSADKEHRRRLVAGDDSERFNDFVFSTGEVEDRYYLSENVAKYVLAGGTKNFRTSAKTDLDVARPLLRTMHKMHRAGVDNYVTYNKQKGVNGIRRLTPRECMRLMGFRDDYRLVVPNTSAYMEAGNSIVVDVLMAILKQLDITKYGADSVEEQI